MIPTVRTLGSQIVLSMLAVTLLVELIVFAGVYLFYGMMAYTPQILRFRFSWYPSDLEWLMFFILSLVGLVITVGIAVRLSRRILEPITSVAANARRISEGDLKARASGGDHPLSEASALVEDFNAMATALESASAGVAHWNSLIAHELRTPVTILRGRLQGMTEDVFKPDKALLHRLLEQVDGLARLVEDLRTVSLFESGHLSIKAEETDGVRMVEEVVDLIEPRLQAAGFHIERRYTAGLVCADAQRIKQAVIALLENALRYATPGKIVIEVRQDAGKFAIAVTDEGPGLPRSFIEAAFTPFSRAQADSDRVSGSGLGLSVVKAIAEAHGGAAHYREGDSGASFEIVLPGGLRAESLAEVA